MNKEKIGIIGTGNYGIALGKRLVKYGFQVFYGSRNPNLKYLRECFEPHEMSSVSVGFAKDAFLNANNFVFFAVPFGKEVYENILNETFTDLNSEILNKIIIVEISNKSKDAKENNSNVEIFNEILSQKFSIKANVVKGFNVINAYSMGVDSTQIQGSVKSVQICSDDFESKQKVIQLCTKIGFNGLDFGPLQNARTLENSNLIAFPDWYYPSVLSLLFLAFNFVWVFFLYFYFPKNTQTFQKYLESFSLFAHFNKILGYTSLQLLAFVYLGSTMASIYQLAYKTKYKKFPKYLDFWLKSRKHFGLWSFLFASAHVLESVCIINPAYLSSWFRMSNATTFTQLTIHGDINILLGNLAYIIMILVALSSVNSIAESLNWREWSFVQTKLGIFSLLIACFHTISMYLVIFIESYYKNYSLVYLLTRLKLYAGIFPIFVLLMRFIFAYFPPISRRIDRIRSLGNTNLFINQNEESHQNFL